MKQVRLMPASFAVVALLLTAGALFAHDFWIVPNAFQVAAGSALELRGQTSSRFPTSTSAVAPERIAEARLVGASTDERLTDLSISGKSLLIRHRPSGVGQWVVGVALVARSARTTPERLKRYIALEGAPALAERYDHEGVYPKTDSVTQVSAKFAKTIVEVGRDGPRAFAKLVGHALEIVPVTDPSTLHAGDTLVVRLLYHGTPLANADLHAGAAPEGLTATSDSAAQAAAPAAQDQSVRTGPDGTARIPLSNSGMWNVRTLHGAPAAMNPAGRDPTWEVYFVTLVFTVAGH